MATISIDRTHNLPHSSARDLAERLARDLEKRYSLAWSWEGDAIHFERPGVSGRMHIGAMNITLDIKLGLLLTPLRSTIEKEINAQLDALTGRTKTG